MGKINAVITGIGGYVPDYVLNNEELSRMVDTSDEWIMARVGIKERHILTEEGLGTSYMARKAAKQLIKKTGVDPDTIDALIVTTTTPDYKFPSTASIVLGKLGLKNAFAFDLEAACCGFLYTLDMAAFRAAATRRLSLSVPTRCRRWSTIRTAPHVCSSAMVPVQCSWKQQKKRAWACRTLICAPTARVCPSST